MERVRLDYIVPKSPQNAPQTQNKARPQDDSGRAKKRTTGAPKRFGTRSGTKHAGRRVKIIAGLFKEKAGVLVDKTNDSCWPFRIKLDDGGIVPLDEWEFAFDD